MWAGTLFAVNEVMGRVFSIILVSLAVFLAPYSAHSGIWKERCREAAEKAVKECKAAEQAMQAADAARSANTAAGSGNDVNQNCQKMGNDIGQQQGEVGKAQGACQAAKGKCQGECEAAKGEAEAVAAVKPIAKADAAAIPGVKSGQCEAPIDGQLAKLAQAMSNLAKNAAQAAACKQASDKGGGGMPPPPQMPQNQDEKKEAEKKEALKCESTEGIRYSDCNNYYLQKCMGAIQSTNCEEFANRYCGSASAGKQADVVIQPESTTYRQQSYKAASVVVDKGGEGLGSGFCNMYASYKFCKNGMRESCPSCQGTHAWDSPACHNDASKCKPVLSDSQLLNAKDKCPTDPIFLDPAVQKQVVAAEEAKKNPEAGAVGKPPTQPGGGGVAGGGGPGGGHLPGVGGGGKEGYSPESAGSGEGAPAGTAVASPTGGSGGGYGAQSAEDEEEGEGEGRGLSGDSIMPAAAVEGMAPDVSNQFGPNVFSISTGVYRAMCTQHRLTSCKPKRR